MDVAILGFGRMGGSVHKALADHPLLRTIHLVDPDPGQFGGVSRRVRTHTDPAVVLADPNVKLVFVTSPNHTHCELALRAVEAGKAVMLEKPMANTLGDAARIVRAARRNRSFLQVGFELRYSKLYSGVKNWIDRGLLGEIVNINCLYVCSEFHGKGSWRNKKESGGSMFGEKLCHYVDLPRWWTGREVVAMHAVAAPNVVPYFEVNDNCHCSYRFDNGACSHLSFMMYLAETFDGDPLENAVSQQADDGHELRFLVTGTRGAAETNVFRRRLRRWEFGDSPVCMTSRIVEDSTWAPAEDHRYFHDTTTQARDIVERVHDGREPFTDAADSLRTMAVVAAAEESMAGGKIVCPRYPALS